MREKMGSLIGVKKEVRNVGYKLAVVGDFLGYNQQAAP